MDGLSRQIIHFGKSTVCARIWWRFILLISVLLASWSVFRSIGSSLCTVASPSSLSLRHFLLKELAGGWIWSGNLVCLFNFLLGTMKVMLIRLNEYLGLLGIDCAIEMACELRWVWCSDLGQQSLLFNSKLLLCEDYSVRVFDGDDRLILPHLTLSHRHNRDVATSLLRDFYLALLFQAIYERFLVLE